MAISIILKALAASPIIAGIVGARIFPEIAPQGQPMPHIVVRLANVDESHGLERATGHRISAVLVIAHAADFRTADTVAEAVRALASSYQISGATIIKDGVDISDYVPATTSFRRVIELKISTA